MNIPSSDKCILSDETLVNNTEHTNNKTNEEVCENLDKSLTRTVYEKYSFYFDYPMLTEHGSVQVFNNFVILTIPQKLNSQDKYLELLGKNQNIQFVFNNQVLFDFNWLPIYTIDDFYKCKHMFYKCYQEYTKLINNYFWPFSYFENKTYDEHMTVFDYPDYYLSCFESEQLTLIELTIKNNNCSKQKNHKAHSPINVEFCIGNNSLFNTKHLLKSLPIDVVHFVISFILFKLIKFC